MKMTKISVLGMGMALGAMSILPGIAYADGMFSNTFDSSSFSFGGFVRLEAAVKTSDKENPNNQRGNPYDSITVPAAQRTPYLPPTSSGTLLNNAGIPLNTSIGTWSTVPLTAFAVDARRPVPPSNNLFNFHILRAEGEFGWNITSNMKLVGRLRTIVDPGHYSDFNGGSLNGTNEGGISGGDPALYGGAPNYFQYRTQGDNHPLPLEWDGPNYQVYFPALFVDYNRGPLDLRVGEQSIAWGNAIFFRVFDTANGIDFRRHSILDYEQEEYSDKRVPAPAVRLSYQATDALLLDGYVEKFQPTIYPNANTPYNIIPVQFTVHDDYSNYESKLNYAARFVYTGSNFSFEGFAGRRYNPGGAFRWTASGVNKALPNSSPIGAVVNASTVANGGSGPLLAGTPFEASPGGVYSAAEWFHYAAMVRLNGLSGLNAAINDFQPSTGLVFASPANNMQEATNELNTFFTAAGGSLRGHIARDYFEEYNFGLGAGYTFSGPPGSLIDQLELHVEVRYTPDRTFTAPDLNTRFLRQDDWVGALILEKYQRFSSSFPATFMVLQYMHREHSDLFGRSLRGYGGSDTSVSKGVAGANYIVFAAQQPLPQDIFRFGFAALYDPRGGILVQPGVEWRYNQHLTFGTFYTYINAHLSGNPNNNVLGGTEFGNEVSVRLAYQF